MLPIARIAGLRSRCVCERDFQWERVLKPNAEKGDTNNWLVVFGHGNSCRDWQSFCRMLLQQPSLVNYAGYGVLLVTSETPEQQLASPLYRGFDCCFVRTLADPQLEIGKHFGANSENGVYEFKLVLVKDGNIVETF